MKSLFVLISVLVLGCASGLEKTATMSQQSSAGPFMKLLEECHQRYVFSGWLKNDKGEDNIIFFDVPKMFCKQPISVSKEFYGRKENADKFLEIIEEISGYISERKEYLDGYYEGVENTYKTMLAMANPSQASSLKKWKVRENQKINSQLQKVLDESFYLSDIQLVYFDLVISWLQEQEQDQDHQRQK